MKFILSIFFMVFTMNATAQDIIGFTATKKGKEYSRVSLAEKLGITQLKENFDGDFVSIVKAIDAEREKAIVDNVAYKYLQK